MFLVGRGFLAGVARPLLLEFSEGHAWKIDRGKVWFPAGMEKENRHASAQTTLLYITFLTQTGAFH
jgi:hypothetical protein